MEVLLFFVFFVLMWLLASLVLAQVGGWAKLAERYATHDSQIGKNYSMRSGYVGSVRYKSCLNLRVCKKGLRLSVLPLFRVGHPPLFIPWDQFHNVSEKRVLFFRFLKMSVGKPTVVTVTLPALVGEYLPIDENHNFSS